MKSVWKFTMFCKMAALKIFAKLHKSPLSISNVVKGAVSDLRQFLVIESPWKTMKKYFLFHLNKLNMLLANQIVHISCIFIKPNVWYSWSLKILAIKRLFTFNFAKVLQGRHFEVGGRVSGPKNFKLFVDSSFKSGLQNIVLLSLLLILCACY